MLSEPESSNIKNDERKSERNQLLFERAEEIPLMKKTKENPKGN